MRWGRTFSELNKSIHDRDSFDCGEPEFNTFIRRFAAKHMKTGISRTRVLPAEDPLANQKHPICSFYTVAPGGIRRETLPEKLSGKLPYYPIPVFLIGQLAVHKAAQGKGLGKITLIKSLEYLWQVNTHMPAYAIIVDCLNDPAQRFYGKNGFEVLSERNGRIRMFIPMATAGQLFT